MERTNLDAQQWQRGYDPAQDPRRHPSVSRSRTGPSPQIRHPSPGAARQETPQIRRAPDGGSGARSERPAAAVTAGESDRLARDAPEKRRVSCSRFLTKWEREQVLAIVKVAGDDVITFHGTLRGAESGSQQDIFVTKPGDETKQYSQAVSRGLHVVDMTTNLGDMCDMLGIDRSRQPQLPTSHLTQKQMQRFQEEQAAERSEEASEGRIHATHSSEPRRRTSPPIAPYSTHQESTLVPPLDLFPDQSRAAESAGREFILEQPMAQHTTPGLAARHDVHSTYARGPAVGAPSNFSARRNSLDGWVESSGGAREQERDASLFHRDVEETLLASGSEGKAASFASKNQFVRVVKLILGERRSPGKYTVAFLELCSLLVQRNFALSRFVTRFALRGPGSPLVHRRHGFRGVPRPSQDVFQDSRRFLTPLRGQRRR